MIVGEFELYQNVPQEERERNAVVNRQRNLPHFQEVKPHDRSAVIVGGGPSLSETVGEILLRHRSGQAIWTMNNTFIYLKEHGIQPDYHVMLDSRPENIGFLHPDKCTKYLLDIRCHPSLFDKLEGYDVMTFDLDAKGTGHTVGMKSIYLAVMSGFRFLTLYGMDSSYREEQHHAYAQPLNDHENLCTINVAGRIFSCAPWMAHQADEFQYIAASLSDQGCTIQVSGDGLLPHVARQMTLTVAEPFYL